MALLEDRQVSAKYREAYCRGVEELVQARRKEADRQRAMYISPDMLAENPEKYREDLIKMLGWPLTEERTGVPKATVCEEKPYAEGITMRRLQIEALPGVPFYGILFLPDGAGARPLVIAQHGGGGTPEQTADMHRPNAYRDMTARLVRAGCVVFAPQLLVWQVNDNEIPGRPGYGLNHNRNQRENELRHLGSGIVAVETYEIMRSLDYLVTLPQVDARRIGMIGLSYGGLYTQMTAALDKRIGVAVTNVFFNDRYRYCWHDFSWFGSALRMKDAEICGLIAPRALCVHVGRNDALFAVDGALLEIERLKPFFAAQNALDRLKIVVSDANHTLSDSGEEMEFLQRRLEQME
ncbi:MAG: dienelactone hydrolase family protein [Eubacteriales bacterium]|nr:dienelactone hydrolase family protein [Eubacteriales bacterium]